MLVASYIIDYVQIYFQIYYKTYKHDFFFVKQRDHWRSRVNHFSSKNPFFTIALLIS
jgi:hypothetical protein